MNNVIKSIHLKKEILVRIIKAYYSGDFINEVRKIPYKMRPKNSDAQYRCCIYKERAVIRDRIVAFLGFPMELDNEEESLVNYAQKSLDRNEISSEHLTVLDNACKGCVPSRVFVTDLCQGCVARACQNVCKFGAISVENGRAVIDGTKCKNCKMCIKECPYNAIVKRTVPCEDVCPVGAISKNENGLAKINFDSCISCGKCMMACPFGAVNERSQIIDVVKQLNCKEKIVALIAPSIVGQFPGDIYQLKSAIKKIGFFDVYEVSQGADITINNEANELLERASNKDSLMTTSCCAGYKELVKKHIPELDEYVSNTRTPASYTAEIVKKVYPDCKTVFISPCVAKKTEANQDDNIDYVINFEELGALLIALKVEILDCDKDAFVVEASKQARGFALSGGVAQAVNFVANDENLELKIINGISRDSIKELKSLAKSATDGNNSNTCTLCEVMCCEGGCVGGSSVLNNGRVSKDALNNFLKDSADISKLK